MERKVQIKKAEQERGGKPQRRSRSRSQDKEESKHGDDKGYEIIENDVLPDSHKLVVLKQGKVIYLIIFCNNKIVILIPRSSIMPCLSWLSQCTRLHDNKRVTVALYYI